MLKEKRGIVMSVKNEAVVLRERCRCLLCWGGGSATSCRGHVLRLAQRCFQRHFFFFFFRDSDHIEPFVSGQFDFYIENLLFCPKQS